MRPLSVRMEIGYRIKYSKRSHWLRGVATVNQRQLNGGPFGSTKRKYWGKGTSVLLGLTLPVMTVPFRTRWGGVGGARGGGGCLLQVYNETSLIRASLIRIPHNPNTVPGNLIYHFLFTMIQ